MYSKWLVIGTLALAMGVHHMGRAVAQSQPGTQPAVEQKDIEKLAALVHATPDQVRQLEALHKKLMEAMTQIKADPKLSDQQRKQQMEELHKQAMVAFHQILTPDQLKILADKGGLAFFAGHGPGGMPFDLLQKLDLTDAQAVQVKRIVADVHQALDKAKSDPKLTPEQLKQRFEQIHSDAMIRLHGVLTPEQMAKLHKMMMEMHLG